MRALKILGIVLILIVGFVGYQLRPMGPPDGTNPPPLADDGDYLTNTESVIFNGSRDEVLAFMADPGLTSFLKPSGRIPAITDVNVLSGTWGEAGAVRRVSLADGGYTAERMLESNRDIFSYQIWDLTSWSGRAIDHIRGDIWYEDVCNGQTRMSWSYSILPKTGLLSGPIRTFLKEDFQPFMENGLNDMAAAFNAQAG